MHSIRRAGLTLTALSIVSAATLLVAPLAYAHHDDAEHKHAQNDARSTPRNTVVNRFVAALDNQVKLLEKQDFDDERKDFNKNDDDGILAAELADIDHVRVLSLASLASRLNDTNAAKITDAVHANTAELHAFLSSGTENATIVDNALAEAGVAQDAALAILPFGDDHLLVLTS